MRVGDQERDRGTASPNPEAKLTDIDMSDPAGFNTQEAAKHLQVKHPQN